MYRLAFSRMLSIFEDFCNTMMGMLVGMSMRCMQVERCRPMVCMSMKMSMMGRMNNWVELNMSMMNRHMDSSRTIVVIVEQLGLLERQLQLNDGCVILPESKKHARFKENVLQLIVSI